MGNSVGVTDLSLILTVAIVVIGTAVCLTLGRALWAIGGEQDRPTDLASKPTILESPLEQFDATMLVFSVPVGSRLAGISVAELRVPAGSMTAVIHRDGRLVCPSDETLVRVGDQVLIAVPAGLEPATRDRMLAVSRGGRLAGWYGDQLSRSA